MLHIIHKLNIGFNTFVLGDWLVENLNALANYKINIKYGKIRPLSLKLKFGWRSGMVCVEEKIGNTD